MLNISLDNTCLIYSLCSNRGLLLLIPEDLPVPHAWFLNKSIDIYFQVMVSLLYNTIYFKHSLFNLWCISNYIIPQHIFKYPRSYIAVYIHWDKFSSSMHTKRNPVWGSLHRSQLSGNHLQHLILPLNSKQGP